MRVNNISSTPSFGRAIKISAAGIGNISKYDNEKMRLLNGLQNALNSKETDVFSDNLAKKIRNFFQNILGDYNGKDGILIQPAGREIALFSGDEAKKVKQFNIKATFTKKWVDDYSFVNSAKKNEINKNAFKTASEDAFKLIENGKKGKPRSILKFKFNKDVKCGHNPEQQKISSILYTSEFKPKPSKNQYNEDISGFRALEAELFELKNS